MDMRSLVTYLLDLPRCNPVGLVFALVVSLGMPTRAQESAEGAFTMLSLGVLATEGATRALEAWLPTEDLLNDAASARGAPYRFRIEPHTDTSLINGLEKGDLDLMLGDPAAFVTAEVEFGARALLSAAHM